MNRFATTALALAAAGSVSYADPGDNEWLELDSEINSLASSLQPSQDGMGWTVLVRTVYIFSSDEIETGSSTEPDTSGLNFKDVDLAYWGNVGNYGWRINADVENNESGKANSPNSIVLEDAHVFWDCGEYFRTKWGQQKPIVIRSAYIDPENMFFIERTAIGSSFDLWDPGVSVDGTWEQLRWFAGFLNGQDGHEKDHFWWLRGEWMLGSGAGLYDGAFGGSDQLNAMIGASYIHDDSRNSTFTTDGDADDTQAIIVDFAGSINQFGFAAEVADFDDDVIVSTDEDWSGSEPTSPIGGLPFGGDGTPWNVSLSWLFTPEWEVGVRYEDLDNSDINTVTGPDNTILTAGVSWYQEGKNAKWQLEWKDVDADDGFADGSIVQAGVSVGASR
jgi:hypothetical protein